MLPSFDIQNISRVIDNLDPDGPVARDLQVSLVLAQSLNSLLRKIAAGGSGSYSLSEDWEEFTQYLAEDSGLAGTGATLGPFEWSLKNTTVKASTVKIYYVNSAAEAAYLEDDGAGNIVDGSTAGDVASGTIDYDTGAISVTFDTGKEPEPGAITADYQTDDRADYETAIDDAQTGVTAVHVALRDLAKTTKIQG